MNSSMNSSRCPPKCMRSREKKKKREETQTWNATSGSKLHHSIHKEKNVFGNVFQIDILVVRNMKLCVWYVCFFLKKATTSTVLVWLHIRGRSHHTTLSLVSLAFVPHFYLTFTSLFAIPNQHLRYPFADSVLRVNPIIFFLNSLGAEAQCKWQQD